MSTTVRSRDAHRGDLPLAPRAVRVRDTFLRIIARKRGLPEPTAADLAQLQADSTLTSAIRWWERVQREMDARPHRIDTLAPVTTRSNLVLKIASITILVMLSLLAFPREAAGG